MLSSIYDMYLMSNIKLLFLVQTGKNFFSITKFDLYKLTIRSIKVINCFIYAGYITKLYSEKDKIIELNKLLFNNLSTKELADIVSVFRSKRILYRYLKNK